MANRTAAHILGQQFTALAVHPTQENCRKAQALYEFEFCVPRNIGQHRNGDFHVGEMDCVETLLTLDIKRHPQDNYLMVRGDFQVMQEDKKIAV